MRTDLLGLGLGFLSTAVVLVAVGVGAFLQGWYEHPPRDDTDPRFIPDLGNDWYYWRLQSWGIGGAVTAWLGYILHQLWFWVIIYLAQREAKTRADRYSTGLSKWNWIALGGNLFFHALHFIKTHIWYDALAQWVAVWSSQVSVVILLVWILLLENQDRGLFFGGRIPFRRDTFYYIRKHHGYVFAWGAIYTLWYHPMEGTVAHLLGFAYTSLILVQGSLMFTEVHRNPYWKVFLEFYVTVHGTAVAVMNGQSSWPMFLFGFLIPSFLTHVFAFALRFPIWPRATRERPSTIIVRGIPFAILLIGWLLIRSLWIGYDKAYQDIFIPLLLYGFVFVFAFLHWLAVVIARKCCCCGKQSKSADVESTHDKAKLRSKENKELPPHAVGYMILFVVLFAIIVAAAVLVERYTTQRYNSVLQIVFVSIPSAICTVTAVVSVARVQQGYV